jgi:hypothetical protein
VPVNQLFQGEFEHYEVLKVVDVDDEALLLA